jgi:large subunit ribosomal protein L5
MTTSALSPSRLEERYKQDIVPKLLEEFGYGNIMAVPRVSKVTLNIGLGEAITNARALESAGTDLAVIAGQKPVITKARNSIAGFKLREGMPIGVMVTLRGRRMYDFLDKLMNAVLPRIRDFRGVSKDAFDGRGNYSLGLREQLIFPEIDYDKIEKVRGLQVAVVTTAKNDEEGRRLLSLMGMPFTK